MLVFLLPLILAYELGLAALLQSDQGVLSNVAHVTLLWFFSALGVPALSGLYLGGVAIVVVLLTWHLLLRDRWSINTTTLLGMAAESFMLTLPLIVIGMLITQNAISMVALAASPEAQFETLDIWSQLAISIGAGLYEELMFRMLLIAIIHTLLVDFGGMSNRWGSIIAVVISAAAFTWYHPLTDATGSISIAKLAFYLIAGLYFGAVFLLRGFGIVVAVHALYDIIMVTLRATAEA